MDDANFAQDLKNRLTLFARLHYDKGQNYFEEYCGIANGTIGASKRNGMSALNLARIASRCPELDLRWLLTGEGEMTGAARPAVSAGGNVTTIGDVSGMTASPVTVHGGGGDAGRLAEALLDQNRALLDQNRALTEQLAAQTETIRRLAGVK